MPEQWIVLGPETTLADLVKVAAVQLVTDELNGFDFDIQGTAPDGSPIVLHFECSVEVTSATLIN
ncbi:MAG: hypothetical protein AB7U29_15295 [Desulfobulbus sp.]